MFDNYELSKDLKEVNIEVASISKINVTSRQDVAALNDKLDLLLERLHPSDGSNISITEKKNSN